MTSKRWVVAVISFAVMGMFDSTVVWFKAGKFKEWSMEFAPDAFMQPPNGKTVTGRAALLTWASAFPPIEAMSFSNVKVSGEGNTAMGTSDYTLKMKDVPTDTGKQIIVARRSAAGAWAIIGGGYNSDLPLVVNPAGPVKK